MMFWIREGGINVDSVDVDSCLELKEKNKNHQSLG